jgi:dTDP-4-amino-4,6-dideoxygalactose transaminase
MLRLNGYNELCRNRVIELMAKYGIATNVHYKPLPMHTAYKNLGFDIKDYPNAFRMYQNEITLPLHTLLSLEDVEYVVFTLKEILATLDRISMQMKIAI